MAYYPGGEIGCMLLMNGALIGAQAGLRMQ